VAERAPAILVVEDNPITLKMLRVTLETEHFRVFGAEDGKSALTLLEAQRPALVIQDFVLPDMTGTELVHRVRKSRGGRDIPVILLTGLVSQLGEFKEGDQFSAVLAKPVEPARLVEIVRTFLTVRDRKAAPAQTRRVLVVDDDPTNRKLMEVQLKLGGYKVKTVATVEEALREARRARPDVILADVLMPGLDGFQLCLAARRDAQLADLPIVLVSSAYDAEADRNLAREVGASDLVLRTPGMQKAIDAIERALRPDARPAQATGPALDSEYLDSLKRQVDRQIAQNQALAERAGIQAAALSMIGALAQALARPREVTSVLGDVLVHCLDAAGISTGLLYLRTASGAVRLQSAAGLPDVPRPVLEAAFHHPELLDQRADGSPRAMTSASTAPAEREFLKGMGRGSALVVPFVVLGRHYGSLVLGSDTHDLADMAWFAFGRTLAAQFGQAIALGQTLSDLTESQELLQNAVDVSPNGMIMVDAAGRIIQGNRQIEQIFGYTQAELVGRPIEDLLPERYRGVHQGERGAFLADPRARQMGAGRDLFGLHKSGREVPVEIGLAPVVRHDRTFVIASVIDITERKKKDQALAGSLARLRALMDNANDGISLIDAEGVLIDVNPRMLAILGRSRDEVVGHHIEEFPAQDAVADHPEAFRQAVVRGGGDVLDVPFRRRDGKDALVDFSLSVVEIGSERVVLAIGRDVTEYRSLERQLRQAQKMEAVGRLAGGVAHDFNNVLTAIFGYADLVMEDLPADSPSRQDLEEVRKAAQRASALTRQLLAFSRQQVLAPVVLSLNDLVEDIDKMLRRMIGEDVELGLKLTENLGNVRADPGQIQQVLLNLVVNARDAMPKGGRLLIETANADLTEAYAEQHQPVIPGPYVRLAVSDTGMGMTPEIVGRIFEPFFTTKEKGKGTGLGLSTVYGIVKQSSGYVWVYSEPGRGTTFKVYLPRVDAPADARGPVREAGTLTGNETVLLAEDDESLRRLAKGLLEKLGYRVLEAENAAQALALAGSHKGPIHLLVSDVVMPGASGRELARRLAESRPDTKVLYMSGYTDDAIVHHGMLEPGLSFLQKPFTPGGLARKVREMLDAPLT